MPKTKGEKQKIIEDLEQKIRSQKSTVFVDFRGLKANDFTRLRQELRKVGGQVQVARKTLMNLAFQKAGFNIEKLDGEVGLVFGFEDAVQAIKSIFNAASENENLKILAGIFEGGFLDKEKVIEIAKIPSRQELLSGLVRSAAAPVADFVSILRGNLIRLLITLRSIKDEKNK